MSSQRQNLSQTEDKTSGELFENLGKQVDITASVNPEHDKLESINSSAKSATGGTNGEADEGKQNVIDEIESLCMNCYEKGATRLLLTRIPYFREIILSSFYCPHCFFKNSEVQPAGQIQQKGCVYQLRLMDMEDLVRQVVKSDTCSVKFIELDIEIPSGRGQLTNIEGLLHMIIEDLKLLQPQRKIETPEAWVKIEGILEKCHEMIQGNSFPFRLEIDDPTGNSWIEPNQKDGVGKLLKTEYVRTEKQNELLGLGGGESEAQLNSTSNQPMPLPLEENEITPDEVHSFPATCPGCAKFCVTHMKMVEIPHFKQVIIMSTVCDHCGYRSNEVKTGGEVPKKGKKITLRVKSSADLARDILKSESCALECPELSLSVNAGTLGGRFTTVEGLLTQVRDDLHQHIFSDGVDESSVNGVNGGDSISTENKQTWKSFFEQLSNAIKGQCQFTIILTDPLASSYVQNLCLPHADPMIEMEEYERTKEEEDDLGLTDMKVEDYSLEENEKIASLDSVSKEKF